MNFDNNNLKDCNQNNKKQIILNNNNDNIVNFDFKQYIKNDCINNNFHMFDIPFQNNFKLNKAELSDFINNNLLKIDYLNNKISVYSGEDILNNPKIMDNKELLRPISNYLSDIISYAENNNVIENPMNNNILSYLDNSEEIDINKKEFELLIEKKITDVKLNIDNYIKVIINEFDIFKKRLDDYKTYQCNNFNNNIDYIKNMISKKYFKNEFNKDNILTKLNSISEKEYFEEEIKAILFNLKENKSNISDNYILSLISEQNKIISELESKSESYEIPLKIEEYLDKITESIKDNFSKINLDLEFDLKKNFINISSFENLEKNTKVFNRNISNNNLNLFRKYNNRKDLKTKKILDLNYDGEPNCIYNYNNELLFIGDKIGNIQCNNLKSDNIDKIYKFKAYDSQITVLNKIKLKINGLFKDYLLTASDSNNPIIKLWDIFNDNSNDNKLYCVLKGHDYMVNNIIDLNNARNLLSISVDGKTIVWDLINNKNISEYNLEETPITASMGYFNKKIIIGFKNGTIKIYNFNKYNYINNEDIFKYERTINLSQNIISILPLNINQDSCLVYGNNCLLKRVNLISGKLDIIDKKYITVGDCVLIENDFSNFKEDYKLLIFNNSLNYGLNYIRNKLQIIKGNYSNNEIRKDNEDYVFCIDNNKISVNMII